MQPLPPNSPLPLLLCPVLQCPKNCAVCTSNAKCTTCLEGFSLNAEDMKCVAPVPAPAPAPEAENEAAAWEAARRCKTQMTLSKAHK